MSIPPTHTLPGPHAPPACRPLVVVVAVVVTAVVAPAQCSLRRNTLEQLVLVRHRVGYAAMALTYCECPHLAAFVPRVLALPMM